MEPFHCTPQVCLVQNPEFPQFLGSNLICTSEPPSEISKIQPATPSTNQDSDQKLWDGTHLSFWKLFRWFQCPGGESLLSGSFCRLAPHSISGTLCPCIFFYPTTQLPCCSPTEFASASRSVHPSPCVWNALSLDTSMAHFSFLSDLCSVVRTTPHSLSPALLLLAP